MYPQNYFARNYWPKNYWPTFGSSAPAQSTSNGIGGGGVSKLTGFFTLMLSFPYGVNMRTN